MGDSLTDRLATSVKTRAPFVIKYVPYGALSEVRTCLRHLLSQRSIFLKPHLLSYTGDAVPLQTCDGK